MDCREQLQEAQYQAAKSNLVPCRNCSRRFTPDRIAVHERICKGPKKPPPGDSTHLQREQIYDSDVGRNRASPVESRVSSDICNVLQ